MRPRIRNVLARCLLIALAVLLAAPPVPGAQPPAADARPFKPQELEQIVAPIALYPDPLVAHIMMASTYPLEVIQAARFAKAHPNLRDDDLNEELKKYDWDNSVKSLVKFPQVLEMMDSQLEWMQKLGAAVLAQQKETMDAVQRLRARARKAGNLKSTQEQKVIVESAPTPTDQTIIKIEPENPEIIYVPAYDPIVIYGPWPYPAYPPYYYYTPYYPVGYATMWFGFGMMVGGSIWGGCNWRSGNFGLHVLHHNSFDRNVNRMDKIKPLRVDSAGGARGNRVAWQHNPEHQRFVQSRDRGTQSTFNRSGDSPTIVSRDSVRGRAEQGRPEVIRGGAGQGVARSRDSGVGQVGVRSRDGGVGAAGGMERVGSLRGEDGAIGSGMGGQGDGAGGGRAFENRGQVQGRRSFSDRGQFSRGGDVSASTFPGNTLSASTFPGNTLSASTFPGNTLSASTFPGSTNTFGVSVFPGNTFGVRRFGGGFSGGGGRR